MKFTKILFVFISVGLITACGGGASSTSAQGDSTQNSGTINSGTVNSGTVDNSQNSGNTNTGNTNGGNANSGSNTPAVLNYITLRHNSVVGGFLATEDTISATLAAQGGYQSGAHYSQSRDNYLAKIQSYLNDSETSYKSFNILLPVDRISVVNLLNTYKTEDKNYAATYYAGVNWNMPVNSLPAFISDVQLRIDAAYSLTIASLP
jgi:hypothetical protein